MLLPPFYTSPCNPQTDLTARSTVNGYVLSWFHLPAATHPTTVSPPSLPTVPAFALKASKSSGSSSGRRSIAPLTATRSAALRNKNRFPCNSASSTPFTNTLRNNRENVSANTRYLLKSQQQQITTAMKDNKARTTEKISDIFALSFRAGAFDTHTKISTPPRVCHKNAVP